MDSLKKKVSLLELDGNYIIGPNKNIYFYFNNKTTFIELYKNNIYHLVDPVYDQIFKSIFTYGREANKITGPQRLISHLNSILYSKYRKKFVRIEYLPNDLVKPNGKSIDYIRVADIVLKAYFENGEILFIDIEIQTNFHKKIFKSRVEYASRLFCNAGGKSLVLVFQIDETNNKSFPIYPCKKEENPFLEDKIDDTYEIVSINVKEAISLIKRKKPIKLGDIDISEEGKKWLKIIGLRFWIIPYENFYILPGKLDINNEIQSAINLLAAYTQEEFVKIIRDDYIAKKNFEDGYLKCEEDMKEKYALELWMYLFKSGNKIIPLDKLDKVLEKNVRELFRGDPDLESFIRFLSLKGKLC